MVPAGRQGEGTTYSFKVSACNHSQALSRGKLMRRSRTKALYFDVITLGSICVAAYDASITYHVHAYLQHIRYVT